MLALGEGLGANLGKKVKFCQLYWEAFKQGCKRGEILTAFAIQRLRLGAPSRRGRKAGECRVMGTPEVLGCLALSPVTSGGIHVGELQRAAWESCNNKCHLSSNMR